MTDIVVPVKDLASSKSRLSAVLSPSERADLVLAMLHDVLCALSCRPENRVWVVASDNAVIQLARRFGAQTLREDRAKGYNCAVELGLSSVASDCPVAVIPADLPLMTSEEFAALIEPAVQVPTVRLVPSRDRNGTNGLFMSSKELLRPSYGYGSFEIHRTAAIGAGAHTQVLELPGIAHDIDVAADLADFRIVGHSGAAWDFLRACRFDSASLIPNSEAAA